MTIEQILKAMVDNSELALYPGGFRLVTNSGRSVPIRNSRFYELFRDGYVEFVALQGHFEVDVIKLGLTPKGREIVG